MTVCIAAICRWVQGPTVLTVSDRQLTAGDVAFQPPHTKVFTLSPSLLVLVAGDPLAQLELCRLAKIELQAKGINEVGAAASVYAQLFRAYRRNRNEEKYLAPLGLDLEQFISRQRDLNPETASQLYRDMLASDWDAQALIVGVDGTGAHIYLIDQPGTAVCQDGIGFAAIGEGYWHAQSEFMFARYDFTWPYPNALLLAYAAKRRAEAAASVGSSTDLFAVTEEGGVAEAPEGVHTYVRSLYEKWRSADLRRRDAASSAFAAYMMQASRETEGQQTGGADLRAPTRTSRRAHGRGHTSKHGA